MNAGKGLRRRRKDKGRRLAGEVHALSQSESEGSKRRDSEERHGKQIDGERRRETEERERDREDTAWEKSGSIITGCLEMYRDVYGHVVIICRWRRRDRCDVLSAFHS